MSRRESADPIVVVGVGAVTPYGEGVECFADALRAGRSAVTAEVLPPFADARPVALLPQKTLAERLASWEVGHPDFVKGARKVLRRATVPVGVAAVASIEAWHHAGLEWGSQDGAVSGVVVGGHDLAMGYEESLREKWEGSSNHLPSSYVLHMMDTDHVGVLSALLDIHGAGMSVGGASASGNMALMQGANLIRLGQVERCLVVGAMAELNPMALQSFDVIGALGGHDYAHAPHEASRPIDKERNGFIYAQGCGALVLERLSSCLARGAEPLGVLAGAGMYLDGTPLPTPSAAGEAAAMERALGQAGVNPSDVDLINAHGTASKAGDVAELEAIASVFGAHAAALQVQGTKGLLGHALWAAGALEAIAVLVQLRDDFVHPNLNLSDPLRGDVGFVGDISETPGPQVVVSNSCGFGGINTSLVITRYRKGSGG
jgi:malonyl-ACP decarboxylase